MKNFPEAWAFSVHILTHRGWMWSRIRCMRIQTLLIWILIIMAVWRNISGWHFHLPCMVLLQRRTAVLWRSALVRMRKIRYFTSLIFWSTFPENSSRRRRLRLLRARIWISWSAADLLRIFRMIRKKMLWNRMFWISWMRNMVLKRKIFFLQSWRSFRQEKPETVDLTAVWSRHTDRMTAYAPILPLRQCWRWKRHRSVPAVVSL